MISLILSAMLAYVPIVDGQRIDLDYVAEVPYNLAITEPFMSDVLIIGGEYRIELHEFTGYYEIGMVETPLLFYSNGDYVGQIVPESSSLLCILTGMFIVKGMRK